MGASKVLVHASVFVPRVCILSCYNHFLLQPILTLAGEQGLGALLPLLPVPGDKPATALPLPAFLLQPVPAYVGHERSALSASTRCCCSSGCLVTAEAPPTRVKWAGAIQRHVSQSD